jgi:4-amino-4-deoxy-L-arabinose transferase-like glycosyltransferase
MLRARRFRQPDVQLPAALNKPVLSYWIVAAFYKVFGVSVGVQRLPIALAAVTMILAAFCSRARAATSRPAVGRGGPGGRAAARDVRRRIFIDIYISMFMALTLTFFALPSAIRIAGGCSCC